MPNSKLSKEEVISAIKNVMDPDLNIDIWTLGLIYDINIREENNIDIKMTLTTPFCPMAPYIHDEVINQVELIGGKNVNVNFTFDPPWKPSDELRSIIGI